jgi:hypothetical protein
MTTGVATAMVAGLGQARCCRGQPGPGTDRGAPFMGGPVAADELSLRRLLPAKIF